MVTVSPALRAQLDEFCTDCHRKVPFVDSSTTVGQPFDLTGAALARPLVVRMTDHVAYGKMPRLPVEMRQAQREALVKALIEHLWTDPAARAEASAYYLEQDAGLPVEPIDSALRMIQRAAGATPNSDASSGTTGAEAAPPSWGFLERALLIDQASFTPAFAAAVALEALRACSAGGDGSHRRDAGAIERCIEMATSPDNLVRGRVH